MKTEYKTRAAYCASIIKAELKAKFPGVKFSVKSNTFSMGNSVDVRYVATKTTPKRSEINEVCRKYQQGYFDGMTDSYVCDNKIEGPTVKFVSVDAYTKDLSEEIKSEYWMAFGITEDLWNDKQAFAQKFGCWREQHAYQYLFATYLK